MSAPPVFEIFFTGKDDPRDGCVVIGEDTKPIFFRFETPETYMGGTRTTVYRNATDVVAFLDWTASLVTIANRQCPMSHFIISGSTSNSRVFLSADRNRQFEWRRCEDDPHSYDLYTRSNMGRIATFRRSNQATPIGPSYAFMSYLFDHELLLLEALVSLCINRVLDSRGF